MINKQKVTKVRRVAWDAKDPRELRGVAQPALLGRAQIELADGSCIVAPLLAHTDMARFGQTFALVFDENTNTFVPIPIGGVE